MKHDKDQDIHQGFNETNVEEYGLSDDNVLIGSQSTQAMIKHANIWGIFSIENPEFHVPVVAG